jgi:anaerobic magnesium-protoporphyrin IX monomethyl ester cyclase
LRLCLFFHPHVYNKSFMLHETYSKHGGSLPPHTLMLVGAAAEKGGHQVKIVDCGKDNLDAHQALKVAVDWSADALGFSLTTYNLHEYISFIREMKNESSLPVIAGGWQFNNYPVETMTHREIDYGVYGEGEITVSELLDALEKKRTLDSVDGILYRENGGLKRTNPRKPAADLDSLPFPDRDLIDNSYYYHLISSGKKMTIITTSRGCPFTCAFCDMGNKKYRHRSSGNVIEEIIICVEKYRIKMIDFQDSTFNVIPSFAKELCGEIAGRNLNIAFIARAHVSRLDDELLRLMKRAGCFLLLLGIETGNDEIMKIMKKGISTGDVKNAIGMIKRTGIRSMGYFVIGLPGDTHETVRETINFSLNLGLDYAQYTRFLLSPNSEISTNYFNRTSFDLWREYTMNPAAGFHPPLVDTSLTVEEADNYLNKAYKQFFLRPSKILFLMSGVRNMTSMIRYAKAAISLLLKRK